MSAAISSTESNFIGDIGDVLIAPAAAAAGSLGTHTLSSSNLQIMFSRFESMKSTKYNVYMPLRAQNLRTELSMTMVQLRLLTRRENSE